jgi:hypothetical protein
MKRLMLFPVLIFFFSACSAFHHMHYRKVKKIPAHGFVEQIAVDQNAGRNVALPAKKDTSAFVNVEDAQPKSLQPVVKAPLHENSSFSPGKDQLKKMPVEKKIVSKKPWKRKSAAHKHGRLKSIFLMVLLLVFGACVIGLGVIVLIGGFYSIALLPILVGLGFIFLGFLPYLQLIFLVKKKNYEKLHGPSEEREMPR